MITRIFLLLCLFNCMTASSRERLYSKSYGNKKDPAIIYIHGGPGYNSASFEVTAARKLSESGYYVIVYDQRGCGRSKHMSHASFNFEEAIDDLKGIYKRHRIKTATLIGHSFGGTIGLHFTKKYPEKVDNLVLISTPINYPLTFKTIIDNCRNSYEETEDMQSSPLGSIEKIDTASREFCKTKAGYALQCGLYTPRNPSKQCTALYDSLRHTPEAGLINTVDQYAFDKWYRNEKYAMQDMTTLLREVKRRAYVYAIFGDEDGHFEAEQLNSISNIIGKCNLHMVYGAAHNVFLDQPDVFLQIIKQCAR